MAKKKPLPVIVDRSDKLNDIMFYGLLALLIIIPLIVFPVKVQHISPLIVNNELTGQYEDSIMYGKYVGLSIGSLVLMTLFIVNMLKHGKQLNNSYFMIPVCVMIILVSLSVLFSDYKTTSIFGRFQVREGALTFLAYLFIFLVSANLNYSGQNLKLIVKAIYVIVGVNAILVVADFHKALDIGLSSTFGNINYMSGMSGVFTTFLVSMVILNRELKDKVINGLFAALSFITLLCSVSLSGFVTMVAMLPLLGFALWIERQGRKGILSLGAILILFASIFVAVNALDSRVWNNSLGVFAGIPERISQKVNSVSTKNKSAIVNKSAVENKTPGVKGTTTDDLSLPPSDWGPATGRIYIWEKTYELIKVRPFFGYGFDTLIYFFPQFDPLKTANLYTPDYYVDKTHNLYLTIAFGSGIFTLLAFMILIIIHCWFCIKLMVKRQLGEYSGIFISLFVGCVAYLIQALVNDPIIPGGVIFWSFLGISCSMLRRCFVDNAATSKKAA